MTLRPSFAPVVVVGAGPAGATAARTLALAGVPVRLLDRSAFPETSRAEAASASGSFAAFLISNVSSAASPPTSVSRLHLEGPDGESTLVESRQPAALMIRRFEFDALLVSLAVASGRRTGHWRGDCSGVDDRERRRAHRARRLVAFAAPIVIAADGVHSVVARRLGLNRGWPPAAVALDMMEETPRSAAPRRRSVDASGWPTDTIREHGANPRLKKVTGARSARVTRTSSRKEIT